MRKTFALKEQKKEAMAVEEMNQQTRVRVARRFAEAQATVEKKR